MKLLYAILVIFLGIFFLPASAQVMQDFNRSANQIGSCWQNYNMKIETQNTINKSNQRKALVGITPHGYPAYYFMSPIIQFNGTGTFSFRHKLTANNGTDRTLNVYLLDQAERVVQTIHSYTYRQGGTSPNGNATNVINVSVPVTWTGTYILRWEFSGSGGNSLGMVDDIVIDGVDVSDGSNDNGYGYCRSDDVVWDTVCEGEVATHTVPFPIPQSTWQWDFFPGTGVGLFDSTVVSDAKDTVVEVTWSYGAAGDYQMEATEIRPPYNTDSYSVLFNIHVLPAPTVSLTADSVCAGGRNTLNFEFTGTGPWELTYTVDGEPFTTHITGNTYEVLLPISWNSQEVSVVNVVDGKGCTADPAAHPTEIACVYPAATSGPIYH